MLKQLKPNVTLKKTKLKITPRSGLLLIENLVKELEIDKLIQKTFMHLKKSNKGLSVSRQLLDISSLLIDGGTCIDDFKQLRTDDAWKVLRNEESSMSPRTAIDLLHKFKEADIAKFEKLTSKIIEQTSDKFTPSDIITIDVDATFIPSEKKHAKIGHHGMPGYYPMLGFWVEKGVVIQGEFRNGNESPGSKALDFFKKCQQSVPVTENTKLRLRSDSAWYQSEIMDYLNDEKVDFAIGGRQTKALEQTIRLIPTTSWETWYKDGENLNIQSEQNKWQIAETVYSVGDSDNQYRVVVIRKLMKGLELLKDMFEYDIVITNMSWEKRRLMKWYFERCNSENYNKELKHGFALKHMPSSKYLANATYFHINLLAYNLVQLLKIIKLDADYFYSTIKTLRYHFFHVAGIITKHARKTFLSIYHKYQHFNFFEDTLACST